MEILKGFAVSQNIVFGKLFFFKKEETVISTENISDCVAEKKRFFAAQKKSFRATGPFIRQYGYGRK